MQKVRKVTNATLDGNLQGKFTLKIFRFKLINIMKHYMHVNGELIHNNKENIVITPCCPNFAIHKKRHYKKFTEMAQSCPSFTVYSKKKKKNRVMKHLQDRLNAINAIK